MKKTLKKGLAYLLAVSMIITYMPATTFALEGVQADPGQVSLEMTVDGITVTAEAEAGVLPEDASLDVSVLKDEDLVAYTDKVEADLEGEILNEPVAIEVKFVDGEGTEIQPEGDVDLTISNDAFEGKTEDLSVYFFEENEEAAEKQYENMDTEADGDTAIKVSTSVAGVFMVTDVQEEAADDDVIQSEAMDPVTSEPDAEEPVAEEPAKDVIPSEARDLDTSEVADGEGTTAEAEAPATPMDFAAQADNGVNVIVNAPAGAFPAGTIMEVKTVSTDEVIGAVSEAVEGSVKSVKAVDITFYDKEGKEIEPQLPISVKMFTTGMSKDSDKKVFHMEGEKAQPMADAKTTGVLTSASFESDAFSIYAIVETGTDARALVKFMNGNTEIKSMYVKENDDMKVVLYDPGAGELAEGVYFRGWTTEPNYTTKTKALTIEDVRTAVEGQLSPSKDGTEITYYAMLFKDYRITYLDENDISLGQEEVTFRADSTSTEQPYTVNMGYTVQDDTHHFEGWNVVEGGNSIVSHTEGKIYQNLDNIKITGDVTFGVNAPEGHWFIFDENGGGTYNAPQFIYSNDKPTRPSDSKMIRNGYTFGGWYADKATADQASGGMQYDFTQTLSDKTTVYARWIPKTTANYTVIIWKENINGDGYDFEESIPLSGTVGRTINTVTRQGSGNNAYARVNGANKQYTGFRLKDFDQNVTIKTEGNSIVNIYYDRNEYTLTFQVQGVYTYTPTTDNDGTQYGLVNGEYVQLTRHNSGNYWNPSYYWTYGDTYWSEGTSYTGTRYTRSGGRYQWSTVKTINAKYGTKISDQFPIAGYENYMWQSQNSNTFGNRWITIADIMPAENVTFHGVNGGTGYKMQYWVQPTNMSTNYNDYELINSITAYPSDADGYLTYEEDFMEMSGFTRAGSDPAFINGSIYHRGNGTMTVNFYYNRKTYPINFMDGKYVDGDGNPMEEAGIGQLGTETGIGFNADVTSYNNYKPSTTPAGYVFEGWYVDDECTHPYTFNKMPEGGITVYAKWRQKEYRVFLHPNYPDNATGNIDWGTTGQKLVFRVSEGEHVSEPTGRLIGYEFVGWYFDAACTQVFNGEAYPINESNVTTPYDKTVDMTDTYDNNGNLINPKFNSDATGYNGGDRFWITKKLDIYAKWRATLEGASGIVVEYDATNNGTGAPTDTHTYVDGAKAPAGAASKSTNNKKVFGHWIVQKWNGSAWEDTSDKVLPGDSFTVLASNAKVEDIENPQQGGDTKKYTVRLKAEYIDSEAPTPTHISWFKNDGTAAYATDENAVINAGVNIHEAPTREGYTFLGWARVATSTSTDYDTAGTEAADWEASSANWTQNLTAYDLYLTYNEAEGETAAYYTIADGTTVTQVAPDENLPYHAMFAVWEAEEDSLTYKPNGGTGENVVISENSLGEPYHVGETLAVATDESVNYTRAGYTFEGWNTKADGTGEDYSAGAEYTLTAGVDELYAQWSANENTQYTVRHWQQNIENDEYTEVVADRETKTGTTDTKTAAAAKTYTGFTAQSFEQQNIAGDGTTVVDIYYNRNKYDYTVTHYTVEADGTIAPYDKPVVESALYGSVINATDVILEEIAEYLYDHAENKDKTTVESITIDVADNILNLFYDADKIGTVDPGEPDNVPDKYQVTINYVAESGGTISGKTKEVLTVVPYAESPDDKTAGTVTTTGSTAQANRNYSFTNWSAGGQTSDNGVFTLDVEGGKTYDITANFQYSGGGGGTPIDDPDVPLDLTTDHYAYVEGYEDGTVKPEGKITRAETATMIYRLLTVDRRDEVFTDQNNYSDVNKPDWYNKAVSSMTKGEYINGYPDGTFKGSNSITRAEFVTILVRFLDGPRDGDLPFSDVKGHWAEQYITTAVQAGWIDGYPDGTFQPDKEISRAEAMKIINTVLHRGVNEHSELGDYINFPDNSDASKWYYYELIEAVNDHEAENERPDENWISNKCEFVYDIDKYERP